MPKSLPNGFFPLGFPTKIMNAFVISPMHATCHAYVIVIDVIILIIFSEQYKL
jgi:hypothetical protein